MESRYTPISDHLYDLLQSSFKDLLPNLKKFEKYFDLLEYFLAVIRADLSDKDPNLHMWGEPGRFSWKRSFDDLSSESETQEILKYLLQHKFFDGSMDRYTDVKQRYKELLPRLQWP